MIDSEANHLGRYLTTIVDSISGVPLLLTDSIASDPDWYYGDWSMSPCDGFCGIQIGMRLGDVGFDETRNNRQYLTMIASPKLLDSCAHPVEGSGWGYCCDRQRDCVWKERSINAYHCEFNEIDQITRFVERMKQEDSQFLYTVEDDYYDANGARAKTVEGAAETHYVYLGHDPICERKGTQYTDYVYLNGELKLKLVGSTGSYAHYYYGDRLGGTRAVYNGTTLTFSVKMYKPFGTPVIGFSGTESVRFAQEMQDYGSTGLYHIYARQMDPELGRFVSMDPELGSLSVPQTQNRYPYCVNNPLKYVDPTGAWIETAFDIGCIAWDIKELWDHPTWENLGWLLVDVGCAIVPLVPAVGGIARLARAVDNAIDVGKPAGRAFDGARTIERTADYSDFFRRMDRAGNYPESQKYFRNALMKLTGRSADGSLQAHHVFPKMFQDIFWDKWRIDIWDPRYGAWVDAVAHGKWSYKYNLEWEGFLRSPGVKSVDDVFDFAKKLGGMPDYGFKVLF